MPSPKAIGVWGTVAGAITGGAAVLLTFVFDPTSPEGVLPEIPPFHAFLQWEAPTENVDGTSLAECVPEDPPESNCLDGYTIHVGLQPGPPFTETLEVEDQSLRNALYDGTQHGEVELFVRMTAYNRKGDVSAFSGQVSKMLSPDPTPLPDPPEPPQIYEKPVMDIARHPEGTGARIAG